MTFVECINRWLADIDLQLHVSKQFGIEIKGHGWTLSESELIPSTLETRSGERRTEMYRVDITADLNDEDEAGYVWTFLDEAATPGRSSQAPSSLPGIKMPLAGGWCTPEHCACCDRSPIVSPVTHGLRERIRRPFQSGQAARVACRGRRPYRGVSMRTRSLPPIAG
jgi:hypothetical protein